MKAEKFNRFTSDWIRDWNNHDLKEIMTHYADDIDFRSPIIQQLGVSEEGQVRGKQQLKDYFERGLKKYPDLAFELYHELHGINSVVLVYRSVNNSISAEYMELNDEGKIQRVRAHYHWH